MINRDNRRHIKDSLEKRISNAFLSNDIEEFERAVYIFETKFSGESYNIQNDEEIEEADIDDSDCVGNLGRVALAEYAIDRNIAKELKLEEVYAKSKFRLVVGCELGRHLHVYTKKKNIDTGLIVFVEGDIEYEVFLDYHRTGKVKRPLAIERIGKGQKECIAKIAIAEIGQSKKVFRRRSGEFAKQIYPRCEEDK